MAPDADLTPASAERDIGALREGVAPLRDRLSTTLFLAGAIHLLLLLGVTFRTPPPARSATPGLDVMLVATPAGEARLNPTARTLAQLSQVGSGAAETGEPPESGLPGLTGRSGASAAGDSRDGAARASTDPQWIGVEAAAGSRAPGNRTTEARRLPELPATGPLWDGRIGDRPHVNGPLRELAIRPDTRESAVAVYLDRWRRHVEEVGTAHYPLGAVRRGAYTGNPVLEVQLLADGTLGAVRLQHSSGVPALDRAAFGILRLAVPFEAFPPELRGRYDALRLTYEWQFSGGRLRDSGWR